MLNMPTCQALLAKLIRLVMPVATAVLAAKVFCAAKKPLPERKDLIQRAGASEKVSARVAQPSNQKPQAMAISIKQALRNVLKDSGCLSIRELGAVVRVDAKNATVDEIEHLSEVAGCYKVQYWRKKNPAHQAGFSGIGDFFSRPYTKTSMPEASLCPQSTAEKIASAGCCGLSRPMRNRSRSALYLCQQPQQHKYRIQNKWRLVAI